MPEDELQQVVDTLRETVLKDLSSMQRFCCKMAAIFLVVGHRIMAMSQKRSITNTACAAIPCREIIKRTCHVLIWTSKDRPRLSAIGRSGTFYQWRCKTVYGCQRIPRLHPRGTAIPSNERLFFRTVTQAPGIRKAVDDIVFDLYGEENPCSEEDYNLAPSEEIQMDGM